VALATHWNAALVCRSAGCWPQLGERPGRTRGLSPQRALQHLKISFNLNFSRGKGKGGRLTFSFPDKDTEDASAAGRLCSTPGKGAEERCFDSEGRPQTARDLALRNE